MSRLLVISPIPTHPAITGNSARLNTLLGLLKGAGHSVSFFLLDSGDGDTAAMQAAWDDFWSFPYTRPGNLGRVSAPALRKLLGLGSYLPYGLDDWYPRSLTRRLEALRDSEAPFDHVMVEYVFFSRALEVFPDSVRLIDTHDTFGDRHELFLARGEVPRWYYTTPEREARGLRRADAILAIQKREQARFAARVPDRAVLHVGHPVGIRALAPPGNDPLRLLFVGALNDINVDALRYLLDDVWPRVRARHGDVQLDVVGTVGKAFEAFPAGCTAHGVVADLESAYAAVDIVVNPVRFGTGLKIKHIEALGFGMPLVTTTPGAEGLEEGAGSAFRVADSPAEFADVVGELLSDAEARETLSGEAIAFAEAYNAVATSELERFLAGDSGARR